jgi:hypothetical protein
MVHAFESTSDEGVAGVRVISGKLSTSIHATLNAPLEDPLQLVASVLVGRVEAAPYLLCEVEETPGLHGIELNEATVPGVNIPHDARDGVGVLHQLTQCALGDAVLVEGGQVGEVDPTMKSVGTIEEPKACTVVLCQVGRPIDLPDEGEGISLPPLAIVHHCLAEHLDHVLMFPLLRAGSRLARGDGEQRRWECQDLSSSGRDGTDVTGRGGVAMEHARAETGEHVKTRERERE